MDTITYDNFVKLDIRIGTIVSVDKVEGSKKLLKVIVDLETEKKQILTGLASFYDNYDKLIGLQVPVLVNLEPKSMAGLKSFGMILMADGDDMPVQISPISPVANGTVVR